MENIAYAQTYYSMSNSELAQLVSEGRDSLNDEAVQALNHELKKRGLTDDVLAREYPAPKPTAKVQGNIPRPPRQRLSIEDFRQLRPWQIVVVGLTLVVTIVFTILRQREAKQDQLYRTVVTSIDTKESEAAFHELVTYSGDHARQLVLRIATRRQPAFFDNTQAEAIRFLGQVGDVETADRLADLLRPYRGLDVRNAVAHSLVRLPCHANCIRSVLDYRERMWRGEPSVEMMLGGRVPDQIAEEKQELDRKLDQVLLKQRQDTLMVLIEVYGLGELEVTPFALHVIEQLKLTEACGVLAIKLSFPPPADEQTLLPRFAEVRRQVNATRQQLNCEDSPRGVP